ncbi:lipopolysaccharide biosynthesis protein [Altererythrobacter sp. Z27]|uniref:lipopolysaccharide biosynthesis protein n=1 Tax=Altererythrobacter sp. Z27 TaxID=3461147 RepID=UPI004044BF37
MSDRRNFLAGLTSSVWAAIAGLIAMPFYVNYLGAEAFGMIGVHLALQGLFMVLDMGFAPAVSREIARSRATGSIEQGRAILHSMSAIFTVMGGVAAFALVMASPWIAESWIVSEALEPDEVRNSLVLSAIALGVRWPGSIYVGALNGAQRIDIASALTIATNTLATIGAILVLAWFEATLSAFFMWQIIVGAGHSLAMRSAAWRIIGQRTEPGYDWQSALSVWRFTVGVAGVATTGALMMNLDRVILSSTTDLEQVGYYTIALALAALLYRLTIPAFNVLYPKLTALLEESPPEQVRNYYQRFSSIILAIIFPAGLFLSIAAEPLLEIWFADPAIVEGTWRPAVVLCFATLFHCTMYLPFALQLAAGNTRLPLYLNLGLLALFMPLLYGLSLEFGLLGAALAWLATHTVYMVVGTHLTGRLILTGAGTGWIWKGLVAPAVIASSTFFVASIATEQVEAALFRLMIAFVASSAAFFLSLIVLPQGRETFRGLANTVRQRMQ